MDYEQFAQKINDVTTELLDLTDDATHAVRCKVVKQLLDLKGDVMEHGVSRQEHNVPTIDALKKPTPEMILQARKAAGLTQLGAAKLVDVSHRTWQDWEHGRRQMHYAFLFLFNSLTAAKENASCK